LQNRHANSMNVSLTVFRCFFVLPICHNRTPSPA
jgi:hypothetical protein